MRIKHRTSCAITPAASGGRPPCSARWTFAARTFTNQTNAPITRLRLRIVDLTTYPAPPGIADLRALTSQDTEVTVHGSPCTEATASIAASGTTVEMPPEQQSYGGGINSSLSVDAVTAATPLLPGVSIPVHVLFGVQQTGDYRIGLIAEGLPDGGKEVLEIHGATNLTSGVPLVTSILRAGPDPAEAFADITYAVTFNDDVDAVDPTDFVLVTNYPGTGAVVTGVTGSGSTRTVHVNAGAGGTVRLDLIDDDSIVSNGVPLGGTGAGNATFRSGEEYTVDVPRVVSVTRAGPDPTGAPTVEFNVNFSEAVEGVHINDFTITPLATDGTWGVYETGIMSVRGSGATRTVTAYTGTGDGAIRLDVLDDNSIIDRYGIALNGLASNDPYTQGDSYTVEHAPRVLDSRSTAFDDRLGLIQYAVRFSEPVSGFDAADFEIAATGSAIGTIVDVYPLLPPPSPPIPWTLVVTVRIQARGGTLRLDVPDSATMVDRSGHGLEYGFADGEPFVLPAVHTAEVPMLGNVALMVLVSALATGALLRTKCL